MQGAPELDAGLGIVSTRVEERDLLVTRELSGSLSCAMGLLPCHTPLQVSGEKLSWAHAKADLLSCFAELPAQSKLVTSFPDTAPVSLYQSSSRAGCAAPPGCHSTTVAASLCRGSVQQRNDHFGKKSQLCVTDEERMSFMQGLI